jgi:hypothetical protein
MKVPTIREEITKFSVKYRDKITTHPNELASTLLEEEEPRRLERFKPTDLKTRIFVNTSIVSQMCEQMIGGYSLLCNTFTKECRILGSTA